MSNDSNQFQTETAPLSTSSANTRPNENAENNAAEQDFSAETSAIESNGANAAADKTPGETQSHNERA